MTAIEETEKNLMAFNIIGQNEDKKDHNYAVILAGGRGTRLFPLSHDKCPKQFVSIDGKNTLIQNTVERFVKIGIKASHIVIIVTDDNQEELASRQLLPFNILSQNIYKIRPNYGYAGAMIMAAKFIYDLDKDAVIINSPSDQHIVLNDDFMETIRLAIKTASQGVPTIVGVRINNLVTFMGCGHAVFDPDETTLCRRVKKFIEKPSREVADEMMRQENSACNTGINVWRADMFLEACQNIDIDSGEIGTDYLMDILGELRVAVGHFKWYDCGTLDSLYEVNREHMTENHHNISFGDITRVGCLDSFFYAAKGHKIKAYNVDDAIACVANFIDGKPVLVVCKRSESQKIKSVAEHYQMYKEFLEEDFSFGSRNNHVVWTDASDECAISFVGAPNYEVVPIRGEKAGTFEWIISKRK